MERIALFPGSFDPFTIGHMAVVTRGLKVFDRIVVGVGVNTSKKGFLTPDQRLELIRDVFEDEERVEMMTWEGLTGDLCRHLGIRHILRGVRNSADFEYERELEMANALMYPEITTTLIFTPAEYIPVSSRLVREIISVGGDPARLLPEGIDIKNYL